MGFTMKDQSTDFNLLKTLIRMVFHERNGEGRCTNLVRCLQNKMDIKDTPRSIINYEFKQPAQKGLRVKVRRERHVHCQQRWTVTLKTLGVPRQDVKDRVKNFIHSKQCAGVVKRMKTYSDPNMLHMALEESMEQDQWQLVPQLVTLNVNDSHKEMVCKKAAAEHLAAKVRGPGIRQKDFKLTCPGILNECREEQVSKFIRNEEPIFGRECCVQLTTPCALEGLSDHMTRKDLDLFLALYRKNQDKTFCQRLFSTAVPQLISNGDDELFVHFFREYFCDADLEGNHQLKDDCRFACLKALEAKKYKCIEEICQKLKQNCQPFLEICLDSVFGVSDLDAVSFLQNVCRLDSYSHSANVKIFKLVLDRLFMLNLKQWEENVPAVNDWLPNCANCCPPFGLHSAIFLLEIDECASDMSGKAEWCLEKSYYNLAFVLTFSLQDWNMLEKMLIKHHYCPPFDLRRCIEKVVELGQFSIAVVLLRHHSIDLIWPEVVCEESRRKLADKCLDSGLMAWAVAFTIPDWDRIHSLLQTGQHPDALNVALMEAMDHDQLDFFKNLVDRCTDPVGVVKRALIWTGNSRRWDYAERLMDKCSDPDVLRKLLKQAVAHGKLEIVRSLVWRIDLKDTFRHIFQQRTSVLNHAVYGLFCEWENSSSILQVLCIFVKAGVSMLDRSVVLSKHDCLLNSILYSPFQVTSSLRNAARLMIQSGAVSYRVLDKLRHESDLQERMKTQTDESWKQCYTDIVEAATTPCSLQHLARLAVSDAIGCHPGRPARIDSLPIPEPLKDLLYFKDVTEQYKEDGTEQYEGDVTKQYEEDVTEQYEEDVTEQYKEDVTEQYEEDNNNNNNGNLYVQRRSAPGPALCG